MAKDNEEEVKEGAEPAAPKKKSNAKLFIIIGVALVVVIGGAAGAYFMLSKPSSKKAAPPKPVVVSILPLEQFVVNIAETNAERYLKVVIQLETNDADVGRELEQFKPRIRDSILDLLTPKTLKELTDISARQRLREDVAGRINNILQNGKVTKVYFTEFVIQ